MQFISYMAPEVALSQPYTETSDVYSFGILLWQICKLELPYEGITDEMVEQKVVHCGFPPKIEPTWPNTLRCLLQDCFASHLRRPHMDVVCNVLRSENVQLSGRKLVDEEEMLDLARNVMSAQHYN
jgi:serine/threonine protein kinase